MKKSVLPSFRLVSSRFPSSLWPAKPVEVKPLVDEVISDARPNPAQFEALEPRMLLSGTPYNSVPFAIMSGTQIEAE
ncbi:MAG: LEPR-XLL domain-containing protein, partial [Planctomycetota bacterium]